ncbi:MAG TPA: hypothetical protein VN696_07720 [Pyrinomonadaceae bacterium]|nr:hypothetical protein [Pyrinomonadaceae bacterium]
MLDSKFRKLRFILLSFTVIAFITAALFLTKSIGKKANSVEAESVYVQQNISKAEFISLGEFPLRAEQDDDAPLKILEAKVHVISGDEYRRLTAQPGRTGEVISKPQVVVQNVSNKTITGIGLMIVDKGAGTKFGIYIKEQSIKPGQRFTVRSENFVRVGGNPAANPKFWLDAVDKTQVVVRVVAFFEDGSMWANKDQR